MSKRPFPSMKAKSMLRVLAAIGYEERNPRGSGSHVWLDCNSADGSNRPSVRWAFHSSRTLAPVEVKRVLCREVGLTPDEALEVCGAK